MPPIHPIVDKMIDIQPTYNYPSQGLSDVFFCMLLGGLCSYAGYSRHSEHPRIASFLLSSFYGLTAPRGL